MEKRAEEILNKLFYGKENDPCAASDKEKNVFNIDMQEYLKRHDIVFLSPQEGGFEGLPLGNGDMAAMVWAEKERVKLQINKADLWTQPRKEAPMLLRSAAQIGLDFGCPIFDSVLLEEFCMRLSPATGILTLHAKTPFGKAKLSLRMLHGTNAILGSLRTEGCNSVRISLERYGSRAFPFWYHTISTEPEAGLGNANVTVEPGKISLAEGFFGEKDKAVNVSVFLKEESSPKDIEAMAENAKSGEAKETENKAAGTEKVTVAARKVHQRRAELEMYASHILDASDQQCASETSPEKEVGEAKETAGVTFEFFICCGTGETKESAIKACGAVERTCRENLKDLLLGTEKYWKSFWNDTRMVMEQQDATWDYVENLYVIQKYMMACGCGPDYPMTFNGGTFTWNGDIRQWGNPHHWNTHMVYNGTPDTMDRPEMMEGYLKAYWNIFPKAAEFSAKRGAPGGILISEMHDFAGRMLAYPGALTPASHIALLFWDHYLYETDETFLKERAYPFMKAAAEFYLQYAKEEHGVFHIYPAGVYECEFGEDFQDTAPDLSAVRALFPACIRAAEILHTDANKCAQWKDFLDRLAPYTFRINKRGEEVLAVGKDKEGKAADFQEQNVTFMRNCAHVYPWKVTGIADKGDRLYEAACHALPDYRPTAVAISPTPVVYARLGFGGKEIWKYVTDTVRQLQHFPQGLYYNLDHWSQYSRYFDREKTFIKGQRDYIYDAQCRYGDIEAGEQKTTLPMEPFVQCGFETPAILMMSLHESAMQSTDGLIRPFPVEDLFGNCGFILKARGGFLVSALLRNGKAVPALRIVSKKGNKCLVDLEKLGGEAWLFEVEGTLQEKEDREKKKDRIRKVGDFQKIAEFSTVPGGEYLILGKKTEQTEELCHLGNFALPKRPNRNYKRYHEASIGRENQFGRKIVD